MVREGWTSSLVSDTKEFEAEQRRAWQQLPVGERLRYIRELSVMAYSAKGIRTKTVDDFRDLILALNKYDVRYVIIGGYAVGVH